jgi:hypothetical protein
MHVRLVRTYYAKGVNGELYINGVFVCHTIELPWADNRPRRSCIPEGTYVLDKRWSTRHQWHLHITRVPKRSLVLIHPANNAKEELQGCIAPVTRITGEGKGDLSRKAFEKLTGIVFPAIRKELVFLTIKSTNT